MKTIKLACSPDADDLFMMRALWTQQVDTKGLTFEIVTQPTDELNRTVSDLEAAPHVAALSFGHYPAVAHRWRLFGHGGSMGEGYGPVLVSKEPFTTSEIAGKRIAIPGETTTAWMILKLICDASSITPVVTPIVPYQGIFDAIERGDVDAGLVIHEGRLTYKDLGLHKVVDIGEWWAEQTNGLPLPLGANAIRRDLPIELQQTISDVLYAAIEFSLTHRDEAIEWLLERSAALKTYEQVDQYLNMYANQRTLDYGEAGRAGVEALYARCVAEGVLTKLPPLDYIPLPNRTI